MYCKCNEPKAVEVIIDNIKHSVCSKNKQGCGKEIRSIVYATGKAKIYINGVQLECFDTESYFTVKNLPSTPEDT